MKTEIVKLLMAAAMFGVILAGCTVKNSSQSEDSQQTAEEDLDPI